MAAKKTKSKAQRRKKELGDLQTNGVVVWGDLKRSNKAFYKHMAEILFWWLGAVEEDGLLDEEYAKSNRKFKSKVKYGINFSPLFILVWGNNGCSDSDLDRHSRAFNKIVEEYFKQKAYYAKDGVAKIAAYIEQSNGINGLTGYGQKKEEDDEETIKLVQPTATDSEKEAVLLTAAISHYSQIPSAPIYNFNTSLPITDEGLSVVLVKRTAAGYELLGATNDKKAVASAAIVNYKHTFSALKPSVRALAETLRTQSLPQHILKIQKDLVDKSKQKDAEGRNLLSMRRLIYRSSTKDYLLSPVRAKVGVVTVAKPKIGSLEEIVGDVFLATRARVALERIAISTYEFNLFAVAAEDEIKKYRPEESASHVIRLQSLAKDTDYITVDFWQYDNAHNQPLLQVDIDFPVKADWHYSTTNTWFRELSINIVQKWFSSHAKHIKRGHQKICKLELNKTEIVFSFVKTGGGFDYSHTVKLSQPLQSLVTLNLLFLTKDIMPVLAAIADFEIDELIEVLVDTNAAVFKFETSAAEFTIAVPTVKESGIRNTKNFTLYKPIAKDEVPFENIDEEFDYGAELAQMEMDRQK